MADFEIVEVEDKRTDADPFKAETIVIPFRAADEIKTRRKQSALIKGILGQGAMSIAFGEPNAGKTFIAMDMAWSIATGRDWLGNKIKKQGAVVYVATEGGIANDNRIAALRKEHNDVGTPFALISQGVNLRDPRADTGPLIETIKAVGVHFGVDVVFVVIDTFARALAGGDENSGQDAGDFITNVDRIRDATGAHTMIVHHSGKDKSRGARGWSGIRAAVDTELEVAAGVVKTLKQRDLAYSRPLGFALKVVSLGDDEDGEEITTCVVEPGSLKTEADFETHKLTPQQLTAYETLKELIETRGIEPGSDADVANVAIFSPYVSEELWRKEVYTRDEGASSPTTKKKAFSRAKNTLSALGLVRIAEQYVTLTC